MSIPQEAKMMRTDESGSARGVVVVTAAGGEQGRRTAQELLDSGWCVAVTARTVAELARIGAESSVASAWRRRTTQAGGSAAA